MSYQKGATPVGDGDSVDLQDADGTVGTTKGELQMGKDINDKSRPVSVVDVERDALKTQDTLSYLLREILVEQKITNKHLSLLTELEIEDYNIED